MNLIFSSIKEQLLENLKELKDFQIKNKFTSSEEQINYLIKKLKKYSFVITVLGEFNRGKTSFINSFLGVSFLPVGVKPTTNTINIISYSETPSAVIKYNNGDIETLTELSENSFSTLNTEDIKEINIGYPLEILKNFNIVDTPGVNDINQQRLEITYEFIPKSDVVIFLLDAEQLLSKTEALFLEKKLLNNDINKIIFVINKSDLISEDDLKILMEHAQKKLSLFISDPIIIPYSSKLALQGILENDEKKIEKSNYYNLIDKLTKTIIAKHELILFNNLITNVETIINKNINEIEVNKINLSKNTEDLEASISLLKDKEHDIQFKLKSILNETEYNIEELKKKEIKELREFGLHFSSVIPKQIEEADYDSIKKYFPLFVQAKFKEFLESRQSNINLELSDITQKALEKVENTLQNLKKDTKTEIDYSNINYKMPSKTYGIDIASVAMVFVGFLFMSFSLLWGGLLVLAGGSLGILFKDKREAEFKEDFKKLAERGIVETIDKIEPKISEIVSEFSQNLNKEIKNLFNNEIESIKKSLNDALQSKKENEENFNNTDKNLETNINYLQETNKKFNQIKQSFKL